MTSIFICILKAISWRKKILKYTLQIYEPQKLIILFYFPIRAVLCQMDRILIYGHPHNASYIHMFSSVITITYNFIIIFYGHVRHTRTSTRHIYTPIWWEGGVVANELNFIELDVATTYLTSREQTRAPSIIVKCGFCRQKRFFDVRRDI